MMLLLLCTVRWLGDRRVRDQLRLLLDLLLLLANCILDVEFQAVHLPLSDVEGLEEDLVGDVAPTSIHELDDGNIESGILGEHRF